MKVTTISLLLLLVLLACGALRVVLCSSSLLYGNETDRLSLLSFKDGISLDPQQVFMSWNDSTHFCYWEGVSCKVSSRRVTSLDLSSRGLVGHISASLGNLTFLRSLHLAENTLSREIPPSLGHLRRLQTLHLTNNTLQGRIPSFANCSKLTVLAVSRNNLVGKFPADLPPRLQELGVYFNNLTGIIPPSLANITTLAKILCYGNNIKGNIPVQFAGLSSLQDLNAGLNQLTGLFPQAILNLSTLVSFSLTSNGIGGEVPPNLCTALPNLQILDLGLNFFQGHIPSSFANTSSLNEIELSGNNFTGLVPLIGKLTKLSYLNLESNQLQAHSREDWKFLDSLSNCTELQVLSVSGNRLSGNVPTSLGNLSNQLQRLYLGANQLSGHFPSGIENLRNLTTVSLWGNQFTGVVPEWIGTLKTLQAINFGSNFFAGFIPSSLSNLSQLGWLDLDSNQFIGEIPPSFGSFPMLQHLDISKNNLRGRIPVEIFGIPTMSEFNLSFNNLNRQLPTDIGNAKQLIFLVLSSNKLSGDIPNTLGNCESLETIELDSNTFSGSIPTSLGNITSLNYLNFSTNDLTGSIPTSLVDLKYLEQIDLSFNHLHGEVPTKGIFKNASAVRIVGNKGLCGGALELYILPCSIIPLNSTRRKKSIVLKVVIPIATMVSLALFISLLFQWRGKHKSKSMSLPSFAREFPKISFNDLARATQGFAVSNLIGRGGYSSVYHGKLFEAENEVAVKVFHLETRGAQKSFIVECNALRNMRHRNLVPILTVCSSIDSNGNDFKALVYEFMPQGDLHNLLYSTRDYEGASDLNLLTMAQRMSIVVDVADAMEYLHHNRHGTMVHCDLKPRNILLDNNMTAHVGDFGLARVKTDPTMISIADPNTSSLGLMGTIGYAAPEYAEACQVSIAADVYSFGVVLLEIFIRRRPTDDMFKDGLSIVKFTSINLPDRIWDIVDPQLIQELELCQETPIELKKKGVRSLISILNIGLCCTKHSPGERINMQEVAAKLHGIRDAYFRAK